MKSHPALGQLELKQYPVEYIDVRIEDSLETSISFVNGEQLQCQELPSLGAFLRVYHNGRWHELATTKINSLNNEVELLVKRALACEAGSGGKLPYLRVMLSQSFKVILSHTRTLRSVLSHLSKRLSCYYSDSSRTSLSLLRKGNSQSRILLALMSKTLEQNFFPRQHLVALIYV